MNRIKERLNYFFWRFVVIAGPFILAANDIITYSDKWGD